jgi:hypothetical protein
MSEEDSRVDGEDQSPLAELWQTPLGRRSMLKAGVASAAALGLGSLDVSGATAAPTKRRRRYERTDLHFALGHVRHVSQLTLIANGRRMPLKRHSKATRAALRKQGGLWARADLSKLTHYVDGVRLPAERGMIVSVRGKRGRRAVLVAQLLRAPRAQVLGHARRALGAPQSSQRLGGSRRRLAGLGLKRTDIRSARDVARLSTIIDQYTTAAGLVGVHPSIANLTLAAATNDTLLATPAITALSSAIALLQGNGEAIADFPAVTNDDGSASQISIPIVQNGKVVGHKTTGFTTFRLNPQNDPTFAGAVQAGLVGGIRAVRNNAALGAVINQPLEQTPAAMTQTWVQPQGVLPQAQPVSAKQDSTFHPTIKNPGSLFGTQTVVNGGFTVDQVPLTLYNNWVRWVWVYVQ